ncbi:MAG: 50S ribosomal protein L29 [Neisseriaceae bacterium]
MKTIELRNKSVAELNEELESLLKAHFSLRMQKTMQQLTKTSELKIVRRDIARVRTILHEKVA